MSGPQSAPVARSLAMYRDPLTSPIKVIYINYLGYWHTFGNVPVV